MKDYCTQIEQYINKEIQVLSHLNREDINTVIDVLENARLNRKRIFTCGNGGSAATASHIVCDLEHGASKNKEIKYDAECLSDNTSVMMAIANDLSYEEIFLEQLKNKGKEGDVLICISGSGNSENVIRAVSLAKSLKMITVGLVGYNGGKLKNVVDHSIHVNVDDMQVVEDVHLVLDHLIMSIVSGDHS